MGTLLKNMVKIILGMGLIGVLFLPNISNADYRDIDWKVTNAGSRTSIISEGTASNWYDTLASGGTQRITSSDIDNNMNIYCSNRNQNMYSGTYKLSRALTYSNTNSPGAAYLFSSSATNTGSRDQYPHFPKQQVRWALQGSMSSSAFDTSAAKDLYNECMAFEEYAAKPYAEPAVIQTEPLCINYLAGPYKITYTYGEKGGKYVGGIINAVMKDKNGNVVDKSKWYIADKDGNRLVNANGYAYPLPNQEFYIKLTNYYSDKAYLTFTTEKITCKAYVVVATGTYTVNEPGVLCQGCEDDMLRHKGAVLNTIRLPVNVRKYCTPITPCKTHKGKAPGFHYYNVTEFRYTIVKCQGISNCTKCAEIYRNGCGKDIEVTTGKTGITYMQKCYRKENPTCNNYVTNFRHYKRTRKDN